MTSQDRSTEASLEPYGRVPPRAIFEHPALYTLVLGAERDATGRIVDWVYRDANANALRMTGHSREALLGRRVSEVAPERARRLTSVCSHVLATGNTQSYDSEFADRDFEVTVYPAGEDTVISTAFDITLRKRAEAALRESEERFRELANNIDQFAWTCDRSGGVTWFNQRWYDYTGARFEDARGAGWQSAVHPEHRDRVVEHFRGCLQSGRSWEDTFPLRDRSGHYRWFLSRAVPIRDGSGEVVRWLGTNTDVTESRQLQVALEQADRRKDEFLAMLAHELRNPLTPIANAAEALLRIVPGGPSRQRLLVEMVQRQAGQLARLIDDLLDVARITQGRIELRMEVVPVRGCIEAAVETVEPLIRGKRQHLILEPPPGPLHVTGDRARLAQCVSNLLVNAVKYTRPGGEIRVRHYVQDEQVVIEVVDSGIGLTPELVPHLFELFFQGDRTLDRSQGGLGVGLAICRQIVEMHGGTVGAHSDGVGKGSTFVIRLPRTDAPDDVDGRSPGRSAAARRVLVVDDNQDAADSLALVLQLEGHEAFVAYTAESAIEETGSREPDFVLLDIGLPHMDGYEVARRIRASGASARIIALTGYGQAADRERSAAVGFAAHLVKPVDLALLRAMLSDGGV